MLVSFNFSMDFPDYVHGAVFPVVFDVRRVLFAGLRDGDVTYYSRLEGSGETLVRNKKL